MRHVHCNVFISCTHLIRHCVKILCINLFRSRFISSQYCEITGKEGIFFYLTTHSTHFIYGYMTSDIW